MKLIRALSFRRVQTFEKFCYTFFRYHYVFHERGFSIQKRDLAMFSFGEHIRKLTIEFTLIQQDHFHFAFSKGDTLNIFFVTIYVPIKISWISLNITNLYIQLMLFSDICFDFCSQSFKFCSKFCTPSFLRFSVSCIFSANLSSYFRS